MDDAKPPFFKGVFAFESTVGDQTLLKHIRNFHLEGAGAVPEPPPRHRQPSDDGLTPCSLICRKL